MANNRFRHGLTTPFTLNSAEVDVVLVTCCAGILLTVRVASPARASWMLPC